MIHSSSNMAEIKALLEIILLLFLISLFHIPKAASKPSGFSLKLIRAYSPMSSLSHINITFLERHNSYVQASKARASYWTSFHESTANKTIKPDVIKPPLRKEGESIVVLMMIGTPAQQVFLEFDTGSAHTWTQCASCTTCFPQSTAKYNPELSKTYHAMSSSDPNCKPPFYIKRYMQKCQYRTQFIAGQYSNGIVSYETFRDTNPLRSAFGNMRFGCSLEAVGFRFPPNTMISGLLAMSRTEESLPRMLSQIGGKGRFSYCLVDINTSPSVVNHVTFGDDIPYISRGRLSKVPFLQHRYPHAWAINLLGISVGEERLNLPPGTFAPNPIGGHEGILLDTGSPYTFINKNAYLGIIIKIQDHLSRNKDFTKISDQSDLCYRYTGRLRRLPKRYLQTITFHLDNQAYLHMPVTSVYFFNWDDNTFCLGMLEAENHWPNILGSLQQQDTRLIYDHDQNSLFFKPEICAGNHA